MGLIATFYGKISVRIGMGVSIVFTDKVLSVG